MRWLRYSMVCAILALVVDAIGIIWALNQYQMLVFGDDRMEYWLDHVVILFAFLLAQTAAGFLLQAVGLQTFEILG